MKIESFEDLKKNVNSATVAKLPSAKQLLESGAKVIVEINMDGSHVRVFDNGYILYTKDGHSTVFTVAHCKRIPYEVTEDYDAYGYPCRHNRIMYVEEKDFQGMVWYMPIIMIGDYRLTHNADERENYYTAYHINCDGNDWFGCPEADIKTTVKRVPFELAQYQAEEADKAFAEWKEEKLQDIEAAMEKLTTRQLEVVKTYYSSPDMTEAKAAKILSEKGKKITQQGVHKNLDLAHKKMGKVMGAKSNKK